MAVCPVRSPSCTGSWRSNSVKGGQVGRYTTSSDVVRQEPAADLRHRGWHHSVPLKDFLIFFEALRSQNTTNTNSHKAFSLLKKRLSADVQRKSLVRRLCHLGCRADCEAHGGARGDPLWWARSKAGAHAGPSLLVAGSLLEFGVRKTKWIQSILKTVHKERASRTLGLVHIGTRQDVHGVPAQDG